MKPIRSTTEYESILKEAKANIGGGLMSNEYSLDTGSIERYASASRLYWEEINSGILILVNMDWYYSMLFIVDPSLPPDSPSVTDKPVQFGLMAIKGRNDLFFDTMRGYWKAAGFELNSTRLRLAVTYNEESLKAIENAHEVIHEVKIARPDQFEEGLALLLSVFNPVTNIFPNKDDMKRSMEDGNFLVIENKEGRIICITECEFGKTSFKLWRIATDTNYRGQRFHWHCRRYATRKAFDMGIRRNIAWVEDWNAKSIHNITSMGMKFDGRLSEQYILKGGI
ncbi:MAG: hypothetical protein LBO70_07415 [Clostridiales Family XIII bacterium]|jgi:hypothetical protein|nr:hypothetical protein [Clostridiales Family XIII bacterium]